MSIVNVVELTSWEGQFPESLMVAAEEFGQETRYNLTFSKEKTERALSIMAAAEDCGVLLATVTEVPAGFAILAIDNDFHVENFGYMLKFYVRPDFRGTGVARALMEACTAWFDRRDTVTDFMTATAGIGFDQAFINLAKRYNYLPAGSLLIRNNI